MPIRGHGYSGNSALDSNSSPSPSDTRPAFPPSDTVYVRRKPVRASPVTDRYQDPQSTHGMQTSSPEEERPRETYLSEASDTSSLRTVSEAFPENFPLPPKGALPPASFDSGSNVATTSQDLTVSMARAPAISPIAEESEVSRSVGLAPSPGRASARSVASTSDPTESTSEEDDDSILEIYHETFGGLRELRRSSIHAPPGSLSAGVSDLRADLHKQLPDAPQDTITPLRATPPTFMITGPPLVSPVATTKETTLIPNDGSTSSKALSAQASLASFDLALRTLTDDSKAPQTFYDGMTSQSHFSDESLALDMQPGTGPLRLPAAPQHNEEGSRLSKTTGESEHTTNHRTTSARSLDAEAGRAVGDDSSTVREMRHRSTTSLPGLIRRALRLAATMESGNTGSRWGTDWLVDSSRSDAARRAHTNNLINSFPTPSRGGTPQTDMGQRPINAWPQADLKEMERLSTPQPPAHSPSGHAHTARNRCCGMPLWLCILLCISALVLIAVAIIVPVVVVVVPNQKAQSAAATSAATSASDCTARNNCLNGGSAVLTANNACVCVCLNGFTGPDCGTSSSMDPTCTTIPIAGMSSAAIGTALPSLINSSQSQFGIPLDASHLLGLFSSSSLSCSSQNALMNLNGVSTSSRRLRSRAAALAPFDVTSTTTLNFARTAILYVFQSSNSLDSAISAQNEVQNFYLSCGIDSPDDLSRVRTTVAMTHAAVNVTLVSNAWSTNLVAATITNVTSGASIGSAARIIGTF